MFTHLRRPRTALAVAASIGGLAAFAGSAQAYTPLPTEYSYALGGSAKINARVKGTVPISGTVKATIEPTSGAVNADVKINTVTANLTEFGFVPIKAKIAFESVGQSTGQLTGSTLTTTTNQTIRLVSATVFGVNIVQGSNCRSTRPSAITLTSNPFDVKTGGKLTGSFGISSLTGCGALNWDLSAAITSARNSVSATLTAG